MFRAVNTIVSPPLFTLEGITISYISAFGAIWRIVPPTPFCSRRSAESDKNVDIYRAGYIISLWSSFETQNWTLETIWNREDTKLKKKLKWLNDEVLSSQYVEWQVSETLEGLPRLLVKLCSQTWDLGKKTLQKQNASFYLKSVQFHDYMRLS